MLAGRCRRDGDMEIVRKVLEKHLKRTVIPDELFGIASPYLDLNVSTIYPGIVPSVTCLVVGSLLSTWTRNVQ